jgi:hypothetical protein
MLEIPRIPRAVAQKLGHYVYIYVDPTDERVFYVGKGYGSRALIHLTDTEKKRVQKRIRTIRAAGAEPRIEILAHNLPDPDTALKIEAAAIDLLGIDTLANVVRGHGVKFGRRPISDLVAHYTRRPAKIKEPSILIRINQEYRYGMSPAELYDATRSAWVLGNKCEEVELAFAVYEGIIREVYRVQAWLPGGSTFNHRWDGRRVRRDDRKEFVGVIAEDHVRKRYVGGYVGDKFKPGSQNPITYLNL